MIEEVLTFWFGNVEEAENFPIVCVDRWFKKTEAIDAEVSKKFGALLEQDLTAWDQEPRGRLAHIIVLDQFSRHIHRGKAEAFKYDMQALPLVMEGIAEGMDLKLRLIERVFFYMPLQHIEDLKIQELSIKSFHSLYEAAPEKLKPMYHEFLKFAIAHHDAIKEFGRFPHRNALLGRSSSKGELAHLKKKGGF